MDSEDYLKIGAHDAFRYGGGLNKSAAEVYWFLLSEPMTAEELTSRTGRSRRTVFRVLARMSRLIDTLTGEVIGLVEKDGDKWRALNVDLNHVARVVGTSGFGRRQQEKHRAERRVHRRLLAIGNRVRANRDSQESR